jgi:hypothetical protein
MDKAELEIGFGDFEHLAASVRLLGKVRVSAAAGSRVPFESNRMRGQR